MMDKLKSIYVWVLLPILILSGCKSDTNAPSEVAKDLSISVDHISLKVDETANVEILSGSGDYTTLIKNVGVATAVVKENNIIIHALSKGAETLLIRDNVSGQAKSLKIDISKDIMLGGIPTDLLMFSGTYKVFTVENLSGDISVSSDDEKVVVPFDIEGSKVTLKAVGFGETKVKVTNKSDGKVYEIAVKVSLRPFELGATEAKSMMGDIYNLKIKSGNGTYEIVENDNPSIFSYEITDVAIKIQTLKTGKAIFKVKDTASGELRPFVLEIVPRNLILATREIEVPIGFSRSIKIQDGNGDYSIDITKGSEFFSATLKDNKSIVLVGSSAGSGEFVIKDNVSGQSWTVAVTSRPLIQAKPFDDGVIEITVKKGESVKVKKTVSYSDWQFNYATWEFDDSVIDVSRSTEYLSDGYLFIFTITGKEPGSTLLTLKSGFGEDEVYLESPVTVLP